MRGAALVRDTPALGASQSCFFRSKLMGLSLLVRCSSTLGSDLALTFGVHCCESAGALGRLLRFLLVCQFYISLWEGVYSDLVRGDLDCCPGAPRVPTGRELPPL